MNYIRLGVFKNPKPFYLNEDLEKCNKNLKEILRMDLSRYDGSFMERFNSCLFNILQRETT
ncbi:hypothetical protein V1I91_01805 [Maribacter cobaltidurans]|uniref:Uncharacterized protein n=1 Tax=Maribacter cobaltidurans TaxID=1178778 RepID=A0ABU7IPA4_9FLAO|nr:hypothetical protein [Maribacter cobaltidurans]